MIVTLVAGAGKAGGRRLRFSAGIGVKTVRRSDAEGPETPRANGLVLPELRAHGLLAGDHRPNPVGELLPVIVF